MVLVTDVVVGRALGGAFATPRAFPPASSSVAASGLPRSTYFPVCLRSLPRSTRGGMHARWVVPVCQATATALQSTSLQSEAWAAFIEAASGEWDGVTATFGADGQPDELPPLYVPDAFREWGVTLYDWQAQCSCKVTTEEGMQYIERKLFPTVGCEADAIAFEEELVTCLRTESGRAAEDKTILPDGSYTVGPRVLPLPTDGGAQPAVRIELCLAGTQPPLTPQQVQMGAEQKLQRLRLVYTLALRAPLSAASDGGERQWRVQQLVVNRERYDRGWDGKKELAGCGGGLPAFAAGPRTEPQVASAGGADARWQADAGAVFVLGGEDGDSFELAGDRPLQGSSWGTASDEDDGSGSLVLLPLGLYSYVSSASAGDLVVEAGVLLKEDESSSEGEGKAGGSASEGTKGQRRRLVAGRRFAGSRLQSTWIGADVLPKQ